METTNTTPEAPEAPRRPLADVSRSELFAAASEEIKSLLATPRDPIVSLNETIRIGRICAQHLSGWDSTTQNLRASFLNLGGMYFPAQPETLLLLRQSASLAERQVNASFQDVLSPGSILSRLPDSEHLRMRHLGMAHPLRWSVRLGIPALPIGDKPKGLNRGLVGLELSSDDAENLVSECGMCFDGTVSFLRRFDISFETEGEDSECDCCGSQIESCDEARVTYIEPFTLTEDMVRHIERQGFLNSAQETLNVGDASFEDMSAAEILEMEQKAAPSQTGARYDARYRFEPDYASLVDGLEVSQVLLILPALVRLNAAHEAERSLPPIPGQLVGAGVVLKWDPQDGTLESRTEKCPIRWHVVEGRLEVGVFRDGIIRTWLNVVRTPDGGAHYDTHAIEVCQNATAIVSLARKEISL